MLKPKTFLVASLIVFFTGCSDDRQSQPVTGTGNASINLTTDLSVIQATVTDGENSRSSKSEPLSAITSLKPSDFSLTMTHKDGEYKGSWKSVDEFPENEDFPVGSYAVKAVYGSDAEGFDEPYFIAEKDIEILEGMNTTIELVASLQNSILRIDYTDAFLNHFNNFSAALTSAEGNLHSFAATEERSLYIMPGKATLTLDVTYPSGNTETMTFPNLECKQATLHRINFDFKGADAPHSGDLKLVISFDDTFESKTVEVDVSDEFNDYDRPLVTPEGFTPGINYDIFQGNANKVAESFIFNIAARGKMKEVKLTVSASVGDARTYDLLSSSDVNALAAIGAVTYGIARDTKYGILDLTSMVRSMDLTKRGSEEETTEFSLKVIDQGGKTTADSLGVNNGFAVTVHAEKSELSSPYTADEKVPSDYFNVILDTTIDNLKENPGRLTLTTVNDAFATVTLSWEIASFETTGKALPYRYTLKVPTPSAPKEFKVNGTTSSNKDCGTLSLSRN